MVIAAYPGSFNPPTVAHLAIAEAARHQAGIDRVDLILSRQPLGKHHDDMVLLEHRVRVLEQVASSRPWLGVVVSDNSLLAELAAGYDVLIMGADKWHQVSDPCWYGGSLPARDTALAALPRLAVAPRPPHPVPGHAQTLHLDPAHQQVSSSAVREGRGEWMVPEATEFDRLTGAWSDPGRYRAGRTP